MSVCTSFDDMRASDTQVPVLYNIVSSCVLSLQHDVSIMSSYWLARHRMSGSLLDLMLYQGCSGFMSGSGRVSATSER